MCLYSDKRLSLETTSIRIRVSLYSMLKFIDVSVKIANILFNVMNKLPKWAKSSKKQSVGVYF